MNLCRDEFCVALEKVHMHCCRDEFLAVELFGDWSSARPRAELVPTCVRDMRSSDLFTES